MISIRNVTFSYSGTGQGKIEDINLDIEKGSCVLLCGRSGCGKTTITRLINGLIAAGVDPKTAEADACRIEHIISDESFSRLKEAAAQEQE